MINQLAIFIFACLLMQTDSLAGSKIEKIALVIGNANYDDSDLKLDNPINDSVAMSRKLTDLGFQTHLIHNTNKGAFESKFAEFIADINVLKAKNDNVVVTVFYAGHGVQLNRVNYLVPVDTQLMQKEELNNRDIEQQFISMQWVTEQLEQQNNLLNIVILDACRDLPFTSLNSKVGGWTEIVKPNFFVAFGTGPGEQSLDGKRNENSVYVSAILSHIDSPGINLSQLFQRVRLDVMEETEGFQVPQESNRSVYDFSFSQTQSSSSQFYIAFLIAIVGVLALGLLLLCKLKVFSEFNPLQTSKYRLASVAVFTLVVGGFTLTQFIDSSGTIEQYFKKLAVSLNTKSDGENGAINGSEIDAGTFDKKRANKTTEQMSAEQTPAEYTVIESNEMAINADRGLKRVSPKSVAFGNKPGVLDEFEANRTEQTNKQIVESMLRAMVRFEGGSLELGSNQFGKESKPVIVTSVGAFSIMSHEVTNEMYLLCVDSESCVLDSVKRSSLDALRPVESVSYEQITKQFIPWLNGLSDIKFRLPTELEWEYAAKFGVDDPFNEKLLLGEIEANCADCFGKSFGRRTAPVMSYSPSISGVFDLLGNVSEWTASCWTPNYQQQYYGDPWPNINNCSNVVIRGGAWHQKMKNISSTGREKMAKSRKSGTIGFRLALSF
ncbi:SUMF1/EgtB/PvdO family nonheme iron enzyme [Psychrosphaera sp. 1_MG-2023]|uniref:SUMF1/EgtB/PvdO family nonheme iron enzyme n=1 Tax=Psychrosphaera sp. 1_MG-2023 TaxID=3062643 RepID=UPI0026E14364|nr:SUMF1/EgtB/PvdO family nonheme iron enzyme [Psychrosphaera sp. 1_MG-2023]MDO6719358.1 SUMF1/EgtB/PvdO family nonheme iron enzyme [Psychrosphaera sp. 1_MG-2023]